MGWHGSPLRKLGQRAPGGFAVCVVCNGPIIIMLSTAYICSLKVRVAALSVGTELFFFDGLVSTVCFQHPNMVFH